MVLAHIGMHIAIRTESNGERQNSGGNTTSLWDQFRHTNLMRRNTAHQIKLQIDFKLLFPI